MSKTKNDPGTQKSVGYADLPTEPLYLDTSLEEDMSSGIAELVDSDTAGDAGERVKKPKTKK